MIREENPSNDGLKLNLFGDIELIDLNEEMTVCRDRVNKLRGYL